MNNAVSELDTISYNGPSLIVRAKVHVLSNVLVVYHELNSKLVLVKCYSIFTVSVCPCKGYKQSIER